MNTSHEASSDLYGPSHDLYLEGNRPFPSEALDDDDRCVLHCAIDVYVASREWCGHGHLSLVDEELMSCDLVTPAERAPDQQVHTVHAIRITCSDDGTDHVLTPE